MKTEIPAFLHVGAGAQQLFCSWALGPLMLMHFLMTSDFFTLIVVAVFLLDKEQFSSQKEQTNFHYVSKECKYIQFVGRKYVMKRTGNKKVQ